MFSRIAVRNETILSRLPVVARDHVVQLNAKSLKFDNIETWPDLYYYRPPFDGKFQTATVFFNGKRQKNGLFFVDQNTNLTMGKVTSNYGTTYGGTFEYNSTSENSARIESSYLKAAEEGRLWLQGWWRVPWEMPVVKVRGINTTSNYIELATNVGDPSLRSGGGL
jgi:hypothetical protein